VGVLHNQPVSGSTSKHLVIDINDRKGRAGKWKMFFFKNITRPDWVSELILNHIYLLVTPELQSGVEGGSRIHIYLLYKTSAYILNFFHNFDWPDGYYAVSTGQSRVQKVRNCLKNQEGHRWTKYFEEECKGFMRNYGFVRLLG
jgi:hypothetical protein